MELWMSGEIQSDVGDAYSKASNFVEAEVNNCIKGNDYGEGLKMWFFIPIIRAEDSPIYGEIAKYYKRLKEVEFRLKIDHDAFLSGSTADHVRLISQSLLRSLKMMPEIGVIKVDLDRLTKDVSKCLSELANRIDAV